MDVWDEAYFPIIEKMNLPIKECGGSALCSAAFYNHKELAEYLLSVGVSVNCRENHDDTPVLCAAKKNHFEMAAYIKNGNLKLEFPKEERLHWMKLYSYMDMPEITYQGKKLLPLVEDSEDYGVLLVWEPQSKKIWFIDPEHEVFHAVSTWMEFIKNAGYYTNRAIIHEFD